MSKLLHDALDIRSIPSNELPNDSIQNNDDGCIDEVADYLVEKKLYLTALEYYFEMMERGKPIQALHHLFTDATFFEHIDRVREDAVSGLGNVLEYELRKKNEELQTLRSELTQITVGQAIVENEASKALYSNHTNLSDPDSTTTTLIDARPHELRALTVLISEYLLRHNYRITSVQFAEECESAGLQDIESWEHVGVNVSKPPSLLHLLRSYWAVDTESHGKKTKTDRKSSRRMSAISQPSHTNGDVGTVGSETTDEEMETMLKELVKTRADLALFKTKNAHLVTQTQHLRNQLICLEREHAEVVRRSVTSNAAPLPVSTVTQSVDVIAIVEHMVPKLDVCAEDDPVPTRTEKITSSSPRTDVSANMLCVRSPSVEFRRHMTEMLPVAGPLDNHIFQLATSLDEFVILVSDRLEATLALMQDEGKILCLPLLTQAICLHPDGSVRDRLLRRLFNLFHCSASTTVTSVVPSSASPVDSVTMFTASYMRASVTSTPSSPALSAADSSTPTGSCRTPEEQHLLILDACRRLASYLGPTRLESELIPQLWSQLNECPPPSVAQRLLIVSACGVISPSTPAELQSSLMLSILESSLHGERNEAVRAATIRSLACLSSLISDWDKLPPLVQLLNRLLMHTTCIPPNGWNWWPLASTVMGSTSGGPSTAAVNVGRTVPMLPGELVHETTLCWLLPAVAQWCLELDSLHTTLIDPWLDPVDDYILMLSQSNGTDQSPQLPDRVCYAMIILAHLVPFLHAWLLVTLIKPDYRSAEDSPPPSYWTTAMSWQPGTRAECNRSSATPISEDSPNHTSASSFLSLDARLILGNRAYQTLTPMFDLALNQLHTGVPADEAVVGFDTDKLVSSESTEKESCLSAPSSLSSSSSPCHIPAALPTMGLNKWSSKAWLCKIYLPKLTELLSGIGQREAVKLGSRLSPSCGSLYNHTDLLNTFIRKQYDEHFAAPWSLAPAQSEQLRVCLSICRFLVTFGRSLGPNGVQKLLAPPFHDALMNQTEHGNYEYNHRAMQTGILAAYCCLLSSVQTKSESNKVRVLLTNAIFLHVRENYPLESIRLAIWCLCLTVDLNYAIHDIILPALRSCVSCADSLARRAAASLLHSMLESLRAAGLPTPRLLEPVIRLVSQLARDDLTGQRRLINLDEADWSVLAVSLGPLNTLILLCDRAGSHDAGGRANGAAAAANKAAMTVVGGASGQAMAEFGSGTEPEQLTELIDQLHDLIKLQCNLVVGRADTDHQQHSDSVSPLTPTDAGLNRVEIAQHRFWTMLTFTLLSLADRLLPSCPDAFRDDVLLPWLYQLAEMSNALPNLEQRASLADRLFAVFSTAAYSLQLEGSLSMWLVPGLDRVRLDLIEAGDEVRTHEVEQFLHDLYSRIRADDSSSVDPKPREPTGTGLRNAVTTQLAKLAHRTNGPRSRTPLHRGTTVDGLQTKRSSSSRVKGTRLSLRKQQ